MDPKTFQKVKFVYPKNKDSVELMRSFFDIEDLPSEFGGKGTLKYDHEEFSKLCEQDDVKSAHFWGFDEKTYLVVNGQTGPDVVPQPLPLAPPAS